MKTTELMIGDWVRCTDPKPFRIEQIDGVEEQVYGDDGFFVDTADLQPIPLKGEIMEKNGFNNRHRRWMWKKKDNYCRIKVSFAPKLEIEGEIFDEPPICLQVDGATFSLKIIVEYVHELQHALKLCGIEKEITI